MYKIALLSTQDHCDYLKSIIRPEPQEYAIHYVTYDAMWELPGLYKSIREEYDGFCTTGAFASEIIRRTWEGAHKPLQSIAARSVEFYHEFFRILNDNRQMDFTRVVLDSDLWLKGVDAPNAMRFLDGVSFEKGRARLLGNTPLERIMMMGERVLESARTLYEAGKIDLVICRSSSAALFLRREGIPCTFVYPDVDNANDAITMLLNEIKLWQSGENLPAAIILRDHSTRESALTDFNIDSVNLLKALLEYDRDNQCDMMIQKAAGGIEVYTNQATVVRLTDQYTHCRLQEHLYQQLGHRVDIGYGIGSDLPKACSHALRAVRQAERSGGGYLVNASGITVSLLDGDNPLALAEEPFAEATAAADKAGLSTGTIQRILSATKLLGTNEITTNDLAQTMKVTTANANRFLNALVKSNQAEVVSYKKANAKGRPSKIYRVNLESPTNIQ